MKNRKNLLLLLVVAVMTGCAPIYLPPAAHVPLMKEKREYQGGMYFGTHGLDIQGAYAFTDHIGFMGTGSFSIAGQKSNSHAYGEAGLGLFSASALSRTSLYAGAGYGYTRGRTSWDLNGQQYNGTASARYIRSFVQSTIAFHTAIFDIGFNPRLSLLQLEYIDADTDILPGKVQAMYLEPVGFMGLGFGDFKLKGQMGFAVPLAMQPQLDHKGFIFSMGFYYRIRPQKLKLF